MLIVFTVVSDVLAIMIQDRRWKDQLTSRLGKRYPSDDLCSEEKLVSRLIEKLYSRDIYGGPWGATSRASDMYSMAIELREKGIVSEEFVEKFQRNYSETAAMYKWT